MAWLKDTANMLPLHQTFMFEMHHQQQGISDHLKQHHNVTQGHKRVELEDKTNKSAKLQRAAVALLSSS